MRVSNNKIKSLASLDGVNTLVTLVADNNKLTTLDDFTVEAKERLVTLSARMNQITDAPAEIHQCSLLSEIFLKNNKIEDVLGEWGELKEKKVRSIELDNNPIADPKIKKMMGKSANFVKELLTYLRKNGKKSASKKKKKPAKAASSDDEDEPEPEPAAPEKKSLAPAPADDESETEEELEARMAKMNKKEREKFKRKLAEERQAKAAKEAAEKRKRPTRRRRRVCKRRKPCATTTTTTTNRTSTVTTSWRSSRARRNKPVRAAAVSCTR